jgi:histidinol-phosphate aminotransferase
VPVSRRSFLQFLGLTGAGAAGAPLVAAPLFGTRGHEALAAALADPAAGAAGAASRAADRALRLHSNENPRGPGAAALDAVRAALGDASRYAGAGPDALRAEVAASHGVPADHVLLGCGSTELLRVAVDAYAGPGRAVVVGAPTFEEPARRAAVVGAPVHAVPVDAALRLDLDAMAARARGAGLLFLNNPNNPTGTLHPAAAVAACVGRVRAEAPGTAVVVDEAYHEYVDDPGTRRRCRWRSRTPTCSSCARSRRRTGWPGCAWATRSRAPTPSRGSRRTGSGWPSPRSAPRPRAPPSPTAAWPRASAG